MIREVAQPLVAICASLVIIFITYSLSRFLVDADAGLLQPIEVGKLTALKALISLDVLLPLSLYLAVMTGLGRLYSDSEIYALRTGGISELRLLQPLLYLAIIVAIVVALFSTWVRPWAYTQSYTIKAAAEASAETSRIRAARFYNYGESESTVFIEHIADNGSDLEGVFIRSRKGQDLRVITAPRGSGDDLAKPEFHRLRLTDAQIFERISDGIDLSAKIGAFPFWMPAPTPKAPGYRVKSASTSELNQSTNAEDRAEFQWRMSTPLSALLLALAAIPLSRSRPRQGRFAKILLALSIYAVYVNLLDVFRSWVEQGTLSFIWWVPGILGILVAALYFPVFFSKKGQPHAQD